MKCLSCMSYWRTDDESIWSLLLKERQPFLLLQGKHDDGQSEDQSLSRASEGDANHVPTRQTTENSNNTFTCYTYTVHIYTLFVEYRAIFCTYTVGIPWIWIGVGCTMPFFFRPFRIAAKNNNKLVVDHQSCGRPQRDRQSVFYMSGTWSVV